SSCVGSAAARASRAGRGGGRPVGSWCGKGPPSEVGRGGGDGGFLGYRGAGMTMPSASELNGLLRGYDRLYGLEILELSDAEVRARVLVRDELKQPVGLLHGGVYASLAESITSLVTAAAVIPEGNTATGLSNV